MYIVQIVFWHIIIALVLTYTSLCICVRGSSFISYTILIVKKTWGGEPLFDCTDPGFEYVSEDFMDGKE